MNLMLIYTVIHISILHSRYTHYLGQYMNIVIFFFNLDKYNIDKQNIFNYLSLIGYSIPNINVVPTTYFLICLAL